MATAGLGIGLHGNGDYGRAFGAGVGDLRAQPPTSAAGRDVGASAAWSALLEEM
ncbi:hypothetical protein [Streptomyces sp. NPDC101149]|uniref:hypothetical protein n=1 Tax=Streptomyces sp. NPDC101149 TaxID=3366113 RepID=UPI003800DB40